VLIGDVLLSLDGTPVSDTGDASVKSGCRHPVSAGYAWWRVD